MPRLSREQVRQFEEDGYLIVKNVFSPEEDLDPVIREYEGVLDRLVGGLFERGEIASRYEELPFGKRLIAVQRELGRGLVQHFDFSLPKANIEADTPIWVGEAIFNALSNPRLLDTVESFIGPEIYLNPIHHVRMKLPEKAFNEKLRGQGALGTTAWHQDNGVATPDADRTNMITVWFPLWDTPISSGPLQIVPKSHLTGLITHCPKNQVNVSIPPELLDDRPMLSVPMKRGEALFLHKLTAHCSLPNLGDDIRWSFDLRYNPIGQPTGRDAFPGFIARSRCSPESELHDPSEWAESWFETRRQLSANGIPKAFNRWDEKAEPCA
jgi:phytanoyl-CoA hydroxylase